MPEETTPIIDTPAAYEAEEIPDYAKRDYTRLESGAELIAVHDHLFTSDRQTQQISIEAEIFGIKPIAEPDRFVAAHNEFIDTAQAGLTEALPTLKTRIINATASYLAKGDEAAAASISETLTNRQTRCY